MAKIVGSTPPAFSSNHPSTQLWYEEPIVFIPPSDPLPNGGDDNSPLSTPRNGFRAPAGTPVGTPERVDRLAQQVLPGDDTEL